MSERDDDTEERKWSSTDDAVGEYDPDQILEQGARMYRKKNEAYGNAWQLTGKTISLWCDEMDVDCVFEADAEKLTSLFLYMHRLEKLIRAFNGEFLADDELAYETIADSHRDAGPYSAMHASLLELGL